MTAVINAGMTITGTWPMRTEGEGRMRGMGSNALSSSIVLVCRIKDLSSRSISLREFISELKKERQVHLSAKDTDSAGPAIIALNEQLKLRSEIQYYLERHWKI